MKKLINVQKDIGLEKHLEINFPVYSQHLHIALQHYSKALHMPLQHDSHPFTITIILFYKSFYKFNNNYAIYCEFYILIVKSYIC